MSQSNTKLEIVSVAISKLKPSEYNPRKMSEDQEEKITESIKRFGLVDPIIVNQYSGREDIIIGGHQRYKIAKKLGYKEMPVVYVNLNPEKEKELNIRLNKNQGEFDYELLKEFDKSFLGDIGFSSEELDDIFSMEDEPEIFDLQKELEKININTIEVQKGDIYELNGSRLLCGDSTIEADVLKLMGDEKAVLCLTDPPYLLSYLHGKTRHGEATTGFGAKKNRRYLETESLPDNFTELWMANVAKVQAENFAIIVYENWKNIRIIWGEMEKYWKVKNMIVWHLSNRIQGFAAKHKFFNKYDIAMVGCTEKATIEYNLEDEDEGLQNEYNTALFAISGKPQWESYEKGKKYCPTDFIEHVAADEKSSGQGIIFGTKPLEILIPYIKVLTKQNNLIIEPFGGSGSTLIAAIKMQRRCYLIEKSPVYAQVILKRWENLTGIKPRKIN
jgi:DNA modification methylase